MRDWRREPRTWRRGGATWLLLALGLFVPTVANAQHCGLDVEWANRPGFEGLGFQWLPVVDPTVPAEPSTSGERPEPPCSGPSCSKAPESPLAPSTTPTPPVEHWASIVSQGPEPHLNHLLPKLDNPSARPIQAGLGVFHPPRLSPSQL